jgi:DNA adenine methylase
MTFYDPHMMRAAAHPQSNQTVAQEDYLQLLRKHAELQMIFHRVKAEPRQMRQTLRYYGGKWKIADWVISHMPTHDVYLEPCFGSGAIFFLKRPSPIEVISDLSGEIVHFFRMLRDRSDDLVRAISLTPYAEAEYLAGFRQNSTDDIERARSFYTRLELGRSGAGQHTGGFRRERRSTRAVSVTIEFKAVYHLYQAASRLQDAQLDQADVFAQLTRYDDPQTLAYLDLPYVYTTRGAGRAVYEHEMSDDDHRRMSESLHQTKCMIMLSGYPSALYDELYADWTCVTRKTRDVNSNIQTECLWLSPAAMNAKRQKRLFELA